MHFNRVFPLFSPSILGAKSPNFGFNTHNYRTLWLAKHHARPEAVIVIAMEAMKCVPDENIHVLSDNFCPVHCARDFSPGYLNDVGGTQQHWSIHRCWIGSESGLAGRIIGCHLSCTSIDLTFYHGFTTIYWRRSRMIDEHIKRVAKETNSLTVQHTLW